MGMCLKLFLLGHVLAFAGILYVGHEVYHDRLPPMPDIPDVPEMWFGPGKRVKEDTSIRPFKINVEDKVLDDLRHRIELDLERIVPPLEGAKFNYGFNSNYLKEVGKYWLEKYDWRAEEAKLNAFPQFKTRIDGLDVHFIHAKPDPKAAKDKKVLPLLIVHGWPGSVAEFTKILPMLTTASPDHDFVFEVIAPSIPGYGFSSPSHQIGFGARQCARVFQKLMTERLGFKKFYTQGGDWGSLITTNLAILYPENILGTHLNMAFLNTPSSNFKTFLAAWLPSGWILDSKDEHMVLPFGEKFSDMMLEMGYAHIQATKPDTVGTALSSSPMGLATYILEKFSTWTNRDYKALDDGGLTKKFSMDELLSNVMVYWINNCITSSQRFYKENLSFKQDDEDMNRRPVTVPVGVVNNANEILLRPRSMLEKRFENLVTYNEYPDGGHFAAMELPMQVATDFKLFVNAVEKREKEFNEKKTEL